MFPFRPQLLKEKEDEISDLKAKFVRHRQILVSNCEQAENEVQRLDEICHETVGQVLKVRKVFSFSL
jgi:hypothetical protein